MRKTILMFAVLLTALISCGPNPKEKALNSFLNTHLQKIQPLAKKANLAYWDAAVSGEDSLYKKYSQLELQLRKVYSEPADYAFLKTLKAGEDIKNPLLSRQLDILLNQYLENQIEPVLLEQIVTLSGDIEQKFSTHRGMIDGKPVTNNQIDQILKTEKNSKIRRKAWQASKEAGSVVSEDLIRLVKLRNKAAQNLGFDNYHTMALTTDEQDVDEINRIFDELYGLTYEPFQALKTELDSILGSQFNVKPDELMPWHYHDSFFQETPLVYDIDLDAWYKNQDIVSLAAGFYAGIGMPVADILANSDLYEKEGKNPHAFCTDIDRQGDVRILCNIKPSERWMETMLHELGHAVYDKYQDPEVPYLLRQPAHTFTTEAIAMLFGRLSRNGAWMQAMLNLSEEDRIQIDSVSSRYAQLKQLIFARWAMVMFKFEQALYENPDQDLNSLWWDLKEKYQLLQRPDKRNNPDWASKIHFTIAPCYYHNYLLGELLASQLHHHIAVDILTEKDESSLSYVNQPKVGDFLKKYVFETGATLRWNEMIRKATGENLNPEYFVNEFVSRNITQ